MTTIISRLYADPGAARAVVRKLDREGFRKLDRDLVARREGEDAARVAARLRKAWVHPDAAPVYADRIADGGAVVVVRADYRPLGARRIARAIFEASDAVASGAAPEEHEVKTPPEQPGLPTILRDHPLFFRIDRDPGTGREPGLISAYLGVPLLTRSSRKTSVQRPGGPVSTAVLPMPLISDRPRKKSVIAGGGTVFSDAIGWKTIVHR